MHWRLERPWWLASAVVAVAACGSNGVATSSTQPPEPADPVVEAPAEESAAIERSSFRSVRVSLGHGPCPEDQDCLVYVELRADGHVEVDRSSTTDTLEQLELTPPETDAIVDLVLARQFLALLEAEQQLCPPVHDVFERTTVVHADGELARNTTKCNHEPLVQVRDALRRLVVERLGDFDPGFHSDSGWCAGVDEGMCP